MFHKFWKTIFFSGYFVVIVIDIYRKYRVKKNYNRITLLINVDPLDMFHSVSTGKFY